MSKNATVLLGVTGSIAAYKAAELLRVMKARGWNVFIIMTRAATHFVGELTFRTLSQNPVAVEMFGDTIECSPEHVSLADRADVVVIAPCTANIIAKLAHGIADDLLTCTALASKAPLVLAPAMNEKMWDHPATQTNVEILKTRKTHIVDVGTGDLACGYQGRGRMADLTDIMSVVERCVSVNRTREKK